MEYSSELKLHKSPSCGEIEGGAGGVRNGNMGAPSDPGQACLQLH